MTSSISIPLRLIVVWLAFVGSICRSFADEALPAAVVAPFVNDDTFFVGYLDLTAIGGSGEAGNPLNLLPQQSPADTLMLQALGNATKGLHAAGAEGLYVVLGLGDIYENGGPLVVVRLKSRADQAAVENMLRGFSQSLSAVNRGMPTFPVERHGPDIFVIGTESTVARYKSLSAGKRDDLVEPLTKLTGDGAVVAAVFSPGADFRRVVRELWPVLPPPLEELRGDLADRWLRLEFAAKSSPQAAPSAVLTLEAVDSQSAQRFVKLLRVLPEASEKFTDIGDKRHELKRMLATIVESVSILDDGPRVEISLPAEESQLAKLQGVVGESTGLVMESTYRRQRMDQFKQMALAMNNYYDVNKHLPSSAIRDKDGRPLLSWRVAILPYLEQNNLYEQFHLDEPWDSPHNLKLSKVPVEIYSDPAHPELAREGKTTYMVPVGPGTVFDTKDGITFRELTDGTSKTIMIVEVPPERAVIWTKPEDWKVDMEHPWRGLERTDRDYVTSAWCDAHASLVPTNLDPVKLRSVLTRAGGEVVDRP